MQYLLEDVDPWISSLAARLRVPSDRRADLLDGSADIGQPGYTTVAQDVKTMSVAIDNSSNTVDLQIDGGDIKGNTSSLQLSGNSYVRN